MSPVACRASEELGAPWEEPGELALSNKAPLPEALESWEAMWNGLSKVGYNTPYSSASTKHGTPDPGPMQITALPISAKDRLPTSHVPHDP